MFSEGDKLLKQSGEKTWISFQLCEYFNQRVMQKAITTFPGLSVAQEVPLFISTPSIPAAKTLLSAKWSVPTSDIFILPVLN